MLPRWHHQAKDCEACRWSCPRPPWRGTGRRRLYKRAPTAAPKCSENRQAGNEGTCVGPLEGSDASPAPAEGARVNERRCGYPRPLEPGSKRASKRGVLRACGGDPGGVTKPPRRRTSSGLVPSLVEPPLALSRQCLAQALVDARGRAECRHGPESRRRTWTAPLGRDAFRDLLLEGLVARPVHEARDVGSPASNRPERCQVGLLRGVILGKARGLAGLVLGAPPRRGTALLWSVFCAPCPSCLSLGALTSVRCPRRLAPRPARRRCPCRAGSAPARPNQEDARARARAARTKSATWRPRPDLSPCLFVPPPPRRRPRFGGRTGRVSIPRAKPRGIDTGGEPSRKDKTRAQIRGCISDGFPL